VVRFDPVELEGGEPPEVGLELRGAADEFGVLGEDKQVVVVVVVVVVVGGVGALVIFVKNG